MKEIQGVMLSIHPKYAESILSGTKRHEYRRHMWREEVRRVFIYACAPVSAVVGEFTALSIVGSMPDVLWAQTGRYGGITKPEFDAYFRDSNQGFSVRIGTVKRYDEPLPLAHFGIRKVPQSFVYVYEHQQL
jgi:predicted transcriptional regulator